MFDKKDIEFIEMLIKEKIKYYKSQKAGIKHFMEYKLIIGENESIIRADRKEIEEIERKIEYCNNLLEKLKVM